MLNTLSQTLKSSLSDRRTGRTPSFLAIVTRRGVGNRLLLIGTGEVESVLPPQPVGGVLAGTQLQLDLLCGQSEYVLGVAITFIAELLNEFFVKLVEVGVMQISITIRIAVIPIGLVAILLEGVT